MRRFSAKALRVCAAARMYSPPAELKQIFESDLEKQKYPTDIVPSDSTLFAKFLFKAAEPKNNYDAILKDFETIQASLPKLPILWERSIEPDQIPEFKALSPPTLFTLMWMKDNGMLDLLPAVRAAYETYVNAQRKKVIAKIYVSSEKDTEAINEAKKAAQETHKAESRFASTNLEYKVIVDKEILSGFSVDVSGSFVSNAKGAADAAASASAATAEIDYTNLPVAKFNKTIWADNVETEVLRKYFDQLAQYDAEEAKLGV
eukprot:GILI01006196.1.p1 GENE.GILI01006196.1~~GILI01006196.1.p1  ORF type:complete len:261 (-),score=112.68 GILI01006196.1:251-1033(-)